MAPVSASDAIATLRAAGHCVTRTSRADAARRYGCQTARYVVDGRGVTLGRLRQMALKLRSIDDAPLGPMDDALLGLVALGLVTERLAAASPVAAEPVAAEPVAAEPLAAEPVAAEPVARPILPGESLPPEPPTWPAPAPALPDLRRDTAAGRRPAPTGAAMAGQPWDPGTPEARAAVALQQERVGILWPIAQALRGEGVTLPMAWQHDGPVMAGEWPLARALAALPPGTIAQAAAALAALPPVTGDQAAALSLCRTGCPGPRHPAAL